MDFQFIKVFSYLQKLYEQIIENKNPEVFLLNCPDFC